MNGTDIVLDDKAILSLSHFLLFCFLVFDWFLCNTLRLSIIMLDSPLLSFIISRVCAISNWKIRNRSSRPDVFLRKGVLKICSKFTGQHSCRSVISVKLQSNFIEITLQHGCSPVNLLYIFRTPFTKNTYGWLLLKKGLKKLLKLK